MLCDKAFGRVCLYVCLSVCNALTFTSLDLDVHFWYADYFQVKFVYQGRRSRSKSRSQEQKKLCLCILFTGGPPST